MAIIKPKLHVGAALASKKGTGGGYAPVKQKSIVKPKPAATLPKPKPVTAAKPVAAKPAVGWNAAAPVPRKDAGFNPGGAPKPRQTVASPAVAKPPAGGAAATGGFLRVLQKQPNGKYKYTEMDRSRMSADQLKRALADPANAARVGAAPATATTAPSGTNPAAPAVPTWTPPKIDLSGLTADPISGRIDWSSIINAASGVAGTDAQYAQELSDALANVQNTISVPQSEIDALTKVDPATGKTVGQTLLAQAQKQYAQRYSSIYGNSAARGIGSSGMTLSNLEAGQVDQSKTNADIEGSYGNQRLAALQAQIQQALSVQNNNFLSAYYGAVNRSQDALPGYGG